MIWGDRRQLKDGIQAGAITALKKVKNRSLGLYRFSAYDLNDEKMEQAALAMLRHKPNYIYAYSMALDYFARVNGGMAAELCALGLKAVIASAESFPKENTRELLARLFGCPVVMEYGTVETGALAYSHPGLGYRVFWQNYFLEATEAGACGGQAVRVTTLYPRCFPLIRYEISDEIDLHTGDESMGLWRFRRVGGRSAFCIVLDDGTRVHHLAIGHCISDLPGIAAWQVVRSPQSVKLLLVSDNGYSQRTERVIMERMGRIHPDLSGVEICRVDRLEQTAAGKTPTIMDHSRKR